MSLSGYLNTYLSLFEKWTKCKDQILRMLCQSLSYPDWIFFYLPMLPPLPGHFNQIQTTEAEQKKGECDGAI